jgi:hypothetical protein
MASPNHNFTEWPQVYLQIRNYFCNECKKECTELNRMLCAEQNLWITEHWEIEYEANKNS